MHEQVHILNFLVESFLYRMHYHFPQSKPFIHYWRNLNLPQGPRLWSIFSRRFYESWFPPPIYADLFRVYPKSYCIIFDLKMMVKSGHVQGVGFIENTPLCVLAPSPRASQAFASRVAALARRWLRLQQGPACFTARYAIMFLSKYRSICMRAKMTTTALFRLPFAVLDFRTSLQYPM